MSTMQTVKYKFERIEKKFRLSDKQYHILQKSMEPRFKRDMYGEATVCNIYYDTKDFALIRRSVERPLFKEKLRLRSYKIPENDDMVFVEIKRKQNGIVYKRRIKASFSDAKRLLGGEPIECENPLIEAEILKFIERYHPKPMVYLTYQRYAMSANDDPEFRVTIDKNLQYRMSEPENPSEAGMKPIMSDDSFVLMEIKSSGAIPLWLAEEMSSLKICQTPFSKVGACYTCHIAPYYSGQKIF